MKISETSFSQLSDALQGPGLIIRNAGYGVCVHSKEQVICKGLLTLYADHQFGVNESFADCHLNIDLIEGGERWLPNPLRVSADGVEWYRTNRTMAFACLEWSLNWFLFRRVTSHLVLHSASLANGSVGMIMPGNSGAGKSTLAAALAYSGWRLLSDELTIIDACSGEMTPIARPVCLKEKSIDVISRNFPDASLGPVGIQSKKEVKGNRIAHLKPPVESVTKLGVKVSPKLIVFPEYQADMKTELQPISRADAFFMLGKNSFNYLKKGRLGFDLLKQVVNHSSAYSLKYSRLDEAITRLRNLAEEVGSRN